MKNNKLLSALWLSASLSVVMSACSSTHVKAPDPILPIPEPNGDMVTHRRRCSILLVWIANSGPKLWWQQE